MHSLEHYQSKNSYNALNRDSSILSGTFYCSRNPLLVCDWIFLILLYTWSFVTVLWVLRHNPGLIEERVVTGFNPDEPTWDKIYMIVLFILVSIVVDLMPLEAVRFHLS